MYAMQYCIGLPADYEMGIIRRRVATNGAAMDGFPGLRFKAFLIRERAAGQPVDEYAPFYVWDGADGMRSFLWGEPGFSRIVRDFGRRRIHSWVVADVADGPGTRETPRWALRTVTALPDSAVPSDQVPALVAAARADLHRTVHTRVLAVDVATWSVCRLDLVTEQPTSQDVTAYEILHLAHGPVSAAPAAERVGGRTGGCAGARAQA